MCDPSITLGENREMLRRESKGEYISQFDDDDLPSADHVSSVIPLLDGVDQIGWENELWIDGVKDPKRDYHTIKAGSWHDTEDAYYRDISHLQPMRRELAMSEPMEGGHGEDRRWAERMRGKVKTEYYIDRVMYYYMFRSNKNRANPCPHCGSISTVNVESGSHCNACGKEFNPDSRKSCFWV
jgi:hypothetical protein